MTPIRKIGFVVNRAKTGACELVRELITLAERRGIAVTLTDTHPVPEDFLAGCDACCVLGGDGTILGAAPSALRHGVPLFGVNRGKLGFLANYPAETAAAGLTAVLDGDCQRAELTLLACTDATDRTRYALNDVVIKTREIFRMAKLGVHWENEFVNTYRADGLIFATPTGSTAYNLGAGGPLIVPGAQVFAMTPICPHTLTNRSVIFPAEARLRVENEDATSPLSVSLDGLDPLGGNELFPLDLRISSRRLPILRPRSLSHFDILRAKLKW